MAVALPYKVREENTSFFSCVISF